MPLPANAILGSPDPALNHPQQELGQIRPIQLPQDNSRRRIESYPAEMPTVSQSGKRKLQGPQQACPILPRPPVKAPLRGPLG